MRTLIRFLFFFFALTGATVIFSGLFNVDLKNLNFWNFHGVIYLVSVTLFPRLTLLLTGLPFSGLIGWAGFFLAPRILVAVLATVNYWNQNPFLVVIAWIVALGGESSEKMVVVRRSGWQSGSQPNKGFENAKEV